LTDRSIRAEKTVLRRANGADVELLVAWRDDEFSARRRLMEFRD